MSELHPLPIAITITSLIFLALYGCYRVALPRPLPGIPHNKKAAFRVFGDAPELVGYIRKHGESFVGFSLPAWTNNSLLTYGLSLA